MDKNVSLKSWKRLKISPCLRALGWALIIWVIKEGHVITSTYLMFRKFPKYSDTQKICCKHSQIWTMWLYHRVMSPNDADGMANSMDPDQTAPLSENLGSLLYTSHQIWIMTFLECWKFNSFLKVAKVPEPLGPFSCKILSNLKISNNSCIWINYQGPQNNKVLLCYAHDSIKISKNLRYLHFLLL